MTRVALNVQRGRPIVLFMQPMQIEIRAPAVHIFTTCCLLAVGVRAERSTYVEMHILMLKKQNRERVVKVEKMIQLLQ